MRNRRDLGLIIDESFESLMTVVYNFYYEKISPIEITGKSCFQQSLGVEYINVETDCEKADKVVISMRTKFTEDTLDNIYHAFLSNHENKYLLIFQYIVAAFKLGRHVDSYRQTGYILSVQKMAKYTSGEAHQLKGFVRFTQTDRGIYYSDISPNNHVLPILAEHFSDRLCDENFIIHDVRRNLAVLYNTKEWIISEVNGDIHFEYSCNEENFRKIWTVFYNTIGIKEREKSKLRMSNMQKRYWKHLTEFKTNLEK